MDGRKQNSKFSKSTLLLLALLAAAPGARAAEDDLPAPINGAHEEEIPSAESDPQSELPDYGAVETLPTPNSARTDEETNLPEPSVNPGSANYQVNRHTENDDIFLPTPAVQDNVNYAPLGTPVSSRTVLEDSDWKLGMNNRPTFSFQIGGAARNYATLAGNKIGLSVGGSVRVISIAQTLFLHAYAAGTLFRVGDVGPYPNVQDITLHMGPMLELGIGRRLSLYGSLLRRSNTLRADEGPYKDPRYLVGVDEPTAWQLGFGAQYDFMVVPHGSLGARVHLERDYAVFYLTMALEPAPRKRLSLNFDPVDRM